MGYIMRFLLLFVALGLTFSGTVIAQLNARDWVAVEAEQLRKHCAGGFEIGLERCTHRIETGHDSWTKGQMRRRKVEDTSSELFIHAGQNGVTLNDKLEEGISSFLEHYYIGYSRLTRTHLVSRRFYEGGDYIFIDEEGRMGYAIGLPVISPNGRWFVSTSSGGESGYVPDAAQLWEITKTGIRKRIEFNFDWQDGWSPAAAKWLGSGRIELTGLCGHDKSPCLKKHLALTGGSWVLLR